MTHRALPALGVLAAVALGVGVATGSGRDSGSERVARQFALAWQRGDYEAMHSLISDPARRRYSAAAFKRAYEQAAVTATADSLRVGDPRGGEDGRVRIGVRTRTRLFGDLRGSVELPVGGERVDWSPDLAFPGLGGGERLVRRTIEPRRGTIVSVDDKVLAQGPAGARSSPLGELASSIAGSVAPSADPKERTALYERGFARDAPTGKTGLERVLDEEVAGRPGGRCWRVAACSPAPGPSPAGRVRSTIDTRLQQSAVAALAGRLGGVAALDPRTGEVRALAGIAFSAPQPPGSTFKIVTTTAALKAGAVKLSDKFPDPDQGGDRRRGPGQRQRRVLRRDIRRVLRRVVQLRVRPAGREGGRQGPRGHRREVRLQRGAGPSRRAAKQPAPGLGNQHTAGGRVYRHRPVQGAGDPAADGLGRPDDRQRRGAPAPQPPAAARGRSPCRWPRRE
ncbi:MAG: penicillin-binding transpeptidase domain-containing protein [Thermoleophilaceae bacterium]